MGDILTDEERKLVECMASYISDHDIKSLMELVMKAIDSTSDKK